MSLFDTLNKVRYVAQNASEFALAVVDDSAIEILQNRLEDGKRADGGSFPEYSENTIGIKRATGGFISPSGNIAWKDTGEFYDSMRLRKEKGFIEIESYDEKAGRIFEQAPTVLDVSEDENNQIFEDKRQEIIDNIEKYIF